MQKEIRTVDEKKGIIQVTTVDERWYVQQEEDKITGLPTITFVPSVTWIADHYPKGTAFYKWLASKGWDEAESIKVAAGDRGSKVHSAINALIKGQEVAIDAKFLNLSTEESEELTFEEYESVLSFADWYKETRPNFLKSEFVVWGDGYAGTVDLLCTINGEKYLIDFKSSQYIWPSHELQVSAYKHAGLEDCKLAILQVGYRLNKKKFKFTEIEDCYQEFLAAKVIWTKEQKGVYPRQRDLPLSVKLEAKENVHAQTAKASK